MFMAVWCGHMIGATSDGIATVRTQTVHMGVSN